ncbi:proteophosphoglycan ppg4 [Rhodotorula toruloides]|uniref:ubiquitinyl hydrolase 1 n=1 Tax=Rhodotorula toruloides TaxID=5286 RepID=A0A511KI18_RHOTO|nr:proteophosphoglycan ppg4 [Rhodotorula toruloides]
MDEGDFSARILGASAGAARPLSLKSLLEQPVRFAPAQGRQQDDEIPYQPINVKPAVGSSSLPNGSPGSTSGSPVASTSKQPYTTNGLPTPPPSVSAPTASIFGRGSSLFPPIDTSTSWPKRYPVGAGLNNLGNTCFLNSALQVLLHTPPLLRYLESTQHPAETNCKCKQQKDFCMICTMRSCARQSFSQRLRSYSPSPVVKNLKKIAKHMRLGRQEDSHEFLRFCIDAMQAAAMYGKSQKLEQKIKETTFVHQIFGGRLRSRVHCLACGHNSDTFDSILDLSLDLGNRANTLKDALDNFVRVDKLSGQNKYKCEKCKKLVNAEKYFAIEDAPLVLTVHLKRFSPTGRKITGQLRYPETLHLAPYMSNPNVGPSYRLYGIILHSGGGPHSGHYTSYVRSSSGKWHDMNDDYVSSLPRSPLMERDAYVLFYMREKGGSLKEAIYGKLAPPKEVGMPLVNGNGKRPRESVGAPVSRDSPSAPKRPRPSIDSNGAASSSPAIPVKVPFMPGAVPASSAYSSSPPPPPHSYAGPRPPPVLTAPRRAPTSPTKPASPMKTFQSRASLPPGQGESPKVRIPLAGNLKPKHQKKKHGQQHPAGKYLPKTIHGDEPARLATASDPPSSLGTTLDLPCAGIMAAESPEPMRAPAHGQDLPFKPPDPARPAVDAAETVAEPCADGLRSHPGDGDGRDGTEGGQAGQLGTEPARSPKRRGAADLRELAPSTREADDDEGEEPLFMAQKRTRSLAGSAASSPGRSDANTPTKREAKARPASSYIPASSWSTSLSRLASSNRGSISPSASSSSHSKGQSKSATQADDDRSPRWRSASHDDVDSAASSNNPSPSLSRHSSIASTRRARPSPTPSFRHSLRLPFLLPSIPASPLPPILSPGLTRSPSSPPVLPAIVSAGPISPAWTIDLPTAELDSDPSKLHPAPTTTSSALPRLPSHPRPALSSFYSRAATSASAPDLSLYASVPPSDSSTSYFPTSIASSPLASTCSPLPLVSAATTTLGEPLSHDPELLVANVEAVRIEEREKVERRQADEKRYHALVELIETERGYVDHLRVLVQVYFQTLPFLTILTVQEVHVIIRNAEQLLELHERIGERVERVEEELGWMAEGEGEGEKAKRVRKAAGRVASIFNEEMPNFALYNDFCTRHGEALDITRSIASRQEWEAFERQCAARASVEAMRRRGERTPLTATSRQNSMSSFFGAAHLSPVSAPPTSNSPLPFTATPLSTPSHSSGTIPTEASLAASSIPSSAAASATGTRSKLRFIDYAISPVQRVTRYPLVFGQLAKYFADTPEGEAIRQAWEGFKRVAQGVDAAKRAREGEMRTRIVARRMELSTPLTGGTFCDVLGPTLLVGAMHVVHSGPPSTMGPQAGSAGGVGGPATGAGQPAEGFRVKYLGCFLYRSHLVMAKIKKRATYEPREWLPLRVFTIQNMEDGQGPLNHSIRLTFRDHHFDLGALCASEKAVWLSHLLVAQEETRRLWDTQELDEHGLPTLFDDSVVSSVPISATAVVEASKRKAHSRSASTISVASVLASAASSSASTPALVHEPLPALPTEFATIAAATSAAANASMPPVLSTSAPVIPASPPTAALALMTTPQFYSPSRFSSTASSLLLGRTPSSQRAAVDLRLADVFSEELLAARAQAARDAELETSAAALTGKRLRTISGPKRSMTALTPVLSQSPPMPSTGTLPKMLAATGGRDARRRMSAFELSPSASDRAEFRGAIGFDAAQAALYQQDSPGGALGLANVSAAPAVLHEKERGRWANAMRKARRSGGGGSRTRPPLPSIDMALVEAASCKRDSNAGPLSAGGSWTRRGGFGKNRERDAAGLGGQLRRVASQPSIEASSRKTPLDLVPTMLVQPDTPLLSDTPTLASSSAAPQHPASPAADVERNNSVSSHASSSGTGTQSSSSHTHSSHLVETPPSSIPPSPDFANIELLDPFATAGASGTHASFPSSSASAHHPPGFPFPSSPRWANVSDGVSNVFRLRQRKSTLGLAPPAVPSPSTSDESLISRSPTLAPTVTQTPSSAVKLQRRASTTLSGLFSAKRRAQSSPILAGPHGYFNSPNNSSPTLPVSGTSTENSSPANSAASTPDQVPTTPEAGAPLQLASEPTRSDTASSSASSVSSILVGKAKEKATSASGKEKKTKSGSSLFRNRSRFLFATQHGMTPLS